MRRTVKSGAFKLISLLLALTLIVSVVFVAAGTMSVSAGDKTSAEIGAVDPDVEMFATFDGDEYLPYSSTQWSRGYFKVAFTFLTTSGIQPNHIYIKESDGTEWKEAGVFSCEYVGDTSASPSEPFAEIYRATIQIKFDKGDVYDGFFDVMIDDQMVDEPQADSVVLEKLVHVKYEDRIDKFTFSSDKPAEGYAKSVKISGECYDHISGIKEFYYRKDDGEKHNIEIKDGKYEILIKDGYVGDVELTVKDNAGNYATTTVSDVRVDSVAPTVTIEDSDEKWAKDQITVTGYAEDDASGVDKVHYAVFKAGEEVKTDPSKDPEAVFDPETGSFEALITRAADGKFNVVFYATDKAGNQTPVASDFKGVTVNFDTKECRIIELECDQKDWTAGAVTVSGKIRDSDSGFDAAAVGENVKFAVTDPSGGKSEWKSVDEAKLNSDGDIEFKVAFNDKEGKRTKLTDSGVYLVEFSATDKAGNGLTLDETLEGTIAYPITIKVDKSEPELEEGSVEAFYGNNTSMQENEYTNAAVTVKGKYTEEQADLTKVTLKLDSGKEFESKSVKRIGTSKTFEFEIEIPAGETYKGGFKLKGVDSAGNGKELEITAAKLYLDGTAPELSASNIKVGDSGWTKKTVISGKATDADSGIKTVFYRKTGTEAWTEVDAADLKLSDDKKTAEFSFETENGDNYDGDYDIMAEDLAGMPTSVRGNLRHIEHGGHVYIDNTKPKIENVGTEYSGDWTNGDLSFTVKAADVGAVQSGVKGVRYSFESNDKYPKDVEAAKNSDGDYEFTVKASDLATEKGMDGGYVGNLLIVAADNAGNDSDPKLVSVKIDTEKGVAEAVTKDFTWTNQPLPVTVSFVDNKSAAAYNSGFSKVEYAMDDDVFKGDLTPSVSGDNYTLTFPAHNYNGSLKLKFYDKAGNTTDILAAEKAMQDITVPVILSDKLKASVTEWTNGGVTITGRAEDLGIEGAENNSGIAAVYYRMDGAAWVELIKDGDSDPGINESAKTADFTLALPEDDYNGKYEFKCVDAAGNESAAAAIEIHQDKTAPKVSSNAAISPSGWTKGEVTITGSLTDTDNPELGFNSGIDKVFFKKTADAGWTELDETSVTIDNTSKTADYTITLPAQDYRGTYDVKCVDKAGNESEATTLKNTSGEEVVVRQDTKAPEIKATPTEPKVWTTILDAITLGFFNIGNSDSDDLTYVLEISDNLSGLDLDTLVISYTDEEGNLHERVKLVDLFDVTFSDEVYNEEGSVTEVKAEFTVRAKSTDLSEIQNMYLEDVSFEIKDKLADAERNTGTDVDNGIKIVDTVDPTRTVKYSVPVNPSGKTESELGDNVVTKDDVLYYNGSASLTFTVGEKNFFPVKKAGGEVKPECKFTVTKGGEAFTDYDLTEWKDNSDETYTATLTLGGGDGVYRVVFEYKDYSNNEMQKFESAAIVIDDTAPRCDVTYTNKDVKNSFDGIDYYQGNQVATIKITEDNFRKEDVKITVTSEDSKGDAVADTFTKGDWSDDGSYHYLEITFSSDANYTFEIEYTDLAANKMDNFKYVFTIDNVPPELTVLNYGGSLRDFVNTIISGVTFGFYNAPLTVDLKYFDATSGCSSFSYNGALAEGVSSVNRAVDTVSQDVSSDKGYTEITLTIPAEQLTDKNNFNGWFNAVMTDRSGNSLKSNGQQSVGAAENSRRLVVDNISPKCSISTTEPVNEAEIGGKKYYYYQGDVKGTITIDEANFYAEDVVFKIDGSDYALTWSSDKDVRKADFVISAEGVHSYYLSYTDRSDNSGGEISKENLVIDLTDPKVEVEYHNKNKSNPTSVTESGREYYGSAQSATITVTETNFRSDDVKLIVSATDSSGNAVSGAYSTGEWSSSGDTHTLKVYYSKDANFTFDIEYQDLAKRSIADYSPDLFTVDATAPQTIGFSYSSALRTKNGKQFYNNPVTVTITCFDATSGVDTFDYEGILASDASSSNAAVVKTAIANSSITKNGGTSTATFTIPASALSSLNQFDGTVTAVAHDRSGNNTTTADSTRLVADNVAPTATMQASSAVQTSNGNRYYSGSITISLSVTEANFSDAETVFSVDGSPVSVSWSSNGDVHTATYTISGDRVHSCSLSCTDASDNTMTALEEKNMVIDTKKPEIQISDTILNSSANNAETLSFTLKVTDDNIVSSDIKPELTAVVTEAKSDEPENSASKLVVKKIDLEKTGDTGKEFTYSIQNLSTDGYYTFKCTATDLAKNSSSDIKCKGSDKKDASVETFNFSVNRNGSTFWVDSNVPNDTYTNSDNISVALHEINIDKMASGTTLRIVDDNASRNVDLNSTNFIENKPTDENYGGWYESVYSLNNSYFSNDSKYSVIATSHDTAGNINVSSDSELSVVSFTVDRTAPVITSNVSDNQSVNATEFDVEFKIADINVDTESIEVKLDDKNVPFKELSGGSYKFTIGSGLDHKIEINVSDLASNKAKAYTVNGITVSTNPIVRWFANKVLFFSTIGGAVLLAGLIVFLILFNKRRKEKSAS